MTTWDNLAPPDQARIRRWQWGVLALGLFCEIMLAADWYGLAAVLPFLSPDLGLDEAQAGFAQGIFALTYGLGMVVWSALSRDWSARAMLLTGLIGTTIGMGLQIYVQSYGQLLTLRLIIGFFDAGVFIGVMKLLLAWFPPARRGLVVGLILAAYSLAITLDFAIGIPLTISYGWRNFFAILTCGTALAAGLVLLFAKPGPAALGSAFTGFRWSGEPPNPDKPELASIFRKPWVYIAGFGIASCTFAIAGTATWVVPAFITHQAMPEASAALIGTLMGLSQVVFLVIGGLMADKGDKLKLIRVSVIMAILTGLMFLAATLWALPFPVLVLMAAISGIAVIGGGAIFALISDTYAPALASAAIGYAEVFGILSSFVAPTIMGVIIRGSGGFPMAFTAFVIAEALFFVVLMTLCAKRRLPVASL
ncbi:nitrate/nitrite transporter [Paracoccus sp. IB05]|uniref:MFS transporter n=1 Tax=Paracoccus sp. IB05 TaxID=2779367 RepID=UPI0018E8B532|nr:MFS transporter [Paracoccus sp. IB05]MBJ2152204.1 MFS transporter [Paracoccus sp. IB05]